MSAYLPLSLEATAGSAGAVGIRRDAGQRQSKDGKCEFEFGHDHERGPSTPDEIAVNNDFGAQQECGAPKLSTQKACRLLVRQSEHCQRAAERGVVGETRVAANRAQTRRIDRFFRGRQLALVDGAVPRGGVLRLQ